MGTPSSPLSALLLVLVLTSCSDTSAPAAAPTASSSPAPGLATSSSPAPVPPPSAPPAALPPTPAELPLAEPAFFLSPTGNLLCSLSADAAGCEIGEVSYELPAKPADCEFDYGQSLAVGTTGRAEVQCVSDTARGSETSVLAYGTRTTNGRFTCSSDATTGVTCTTVDGAHGFRLSRARYGLF